MTSLILLKSILIANQLQNSKKKKSIKKHHDSGKAKTKFDLTTCRVCNFEKGEIPIFDNFLEPNIPNEIKNFTGIQMTKEENMPGQICQSCMDLLNGCIMFREMCQRTNKSLLELAVKKEVEEQTLSVSYDNIPSPSFSDHSEIWDCSVCHKEFYSLKSCNKHQSQCTKEPVSESKATDENVKGKKSFLCDICGKIAKSHASLLIHKSTHENVFPYKCDQCPYQGRTSDLLKVHKRSHMADKPFKCTQCPKATTTSSNLAKHMRHVHSTTRPYKCTYCDKAFSYQHDTKRHIRDIHLRQGTVKCDVCLKKFNTKKILQGHRWKIHKIKGQRQGRLPSYLQQQTGENDIMPFFYEP